MGYVWSGSLSVSNQGWYAQVVVDAAMCVMRYAVLSQQNVSRELLPARCAARHGGTHLRKQVQDSVAHGIRGVYHPIAHDPADRSC